MKKIIYLLLALSVVFVACGKDNDKGNTKEDPISITTLKSSQISFFSAMVSGQANPANRFAECEIGVLLSKSEDPQLENSAKVETEDFEAGFVFNIFLENLAPGTKYYYKAYLLLDDEFIFGETKWFQTTDGSSLITSASHSFQDYNIVKLTAVFAEGAPILSGVTYGFLLTSPAGATGFKAGIYNKTNRTLQFTSSALAQGEWGYQVCLKFSDGELAPIGNKQSFLIQAEGQMEVSTAICGWMELPQDLSNNDIHWVRHDMTLHSRTVRNYSMCYSYSDLISYWVAYPLNDDYIGNHYGRSEAWGYDPNVPESYQFNITSTYGKWGIARGHQLPSADRQDSYERNASTYYSTNITPQDYEFNSGTWGNLENKVRYWAGRCDTLYVVTGAVRGSSSLKSVNVPSAYFKALLAFNSGNFGIDGYAGIAFWYPHRFYDEDYDPNTTDNQSITKSSAISITTLEGTLGYELFPNLRVKLGRIKADNIKSENPSGNTWWW